MAGHSGDDLEAVAGLLSGIADDLNSPTSDDEPMDADDLDATLRAMRHDVPDAACPVPHHGDDPPEPPPAAEPANPRAAILARARAAKAEKRLKALADARAAQVEGGTALGGSEGVLVAGSSAEPRRAPIVVPSAILTCIDSRLTGPFQGPHLQAGVQSAARATAPRESAHGADVSKVVDFLCKSAEVPVETKGALAERLAVDRSTLDKMVPAMANAVLVLDQTSRRQHESAFRQDLEPLLFVDAARYDETPMKMSTAHTELLVPQVSAGRPAQNALAPPAARISLGVGKGTSKLLQTECSFGMFLKQPTAPDDVAKYVGVRGNVATFVQDLVCGTGEAYANALQHASSPSPCSQEFRLPMRLCTTDKGSANSVAERILMSRRSGSWSHLQASCDVHTAAGCHTKTSVLVSKDVSSLLHMALGLQLTGNMQKFRRCVIEDIRSRMVWKHGTPSQSATAFRRHVLDLFLARGPDYRARRASLQVYLSGDWRNQQHVEYHFHNPGMDDQLDRRKLAHMIALGVARTLTSRQIAVYPRHRWVGFDLSLDQLGLLEAAHGILRHSFVRFCSLHGPHPRRTSAGLGASDATHGGDAVPLEDDLDLDGGEAVEGGPAVDEGGEADVAEGAPNAASTFAERNRKHLSIAAEYLSSQPLGRIMILRKVFEPFRVLLNRLIHMSSDAWEAEQAAIEAKFLLGRGVAERTFRAQVAAAQTLENDFADAVKRLADVSCWEHLPPKHWDWETRALVFRLLSRA